jgi:hypothetical protein
MKSTVDNSIAIKEHEPGVVHRVIITEEGASEIGQK